jgi:hypothetical protein
MAAAQSSSHHVYVSSDVVVKIIDAAGHSRLDRETALAPHLPAGLTALFLGGGLGTRTSARQTLGEPLDHGGFVSQAARATATPVETLRAQCEIRDAAYLASDLRVALERPGFPARMAANRLRGLEELIVGRYWWRHTR